MAILICVLLSVRHMNFVTIRTMHCFKPRYLNHLVAGKLCLKLFHTDITKLELPLIAAT